MGYYFVIGISCLIIGILLGLLIRRKPTSSANPAVNPTPSGDLIKKIVERAIKDYELNKRTDEIIEDINKYLEEESQ